MLLAGWPCQPNSDMNLYSDDDTVAAGHALWEEAFTQMLLLRPSVIVMENLPTLLNLRLLPVLEAIAARLEASGYTWALDVLCPSLVGAIATRPRLIFVGSAPSSA